MQIPPYFPQTSVYGELTPSSLIDQTAAHEEELTNLIKQLPSFLRDREGTITDIKRKLTYLASLNLPISSLKNLSCWEKTQIVAAMNSSFPQQEPSKSLLEDKNITPSSTTEIKREEQQLAPAQNMSQTESDPTHSNSDDSLKKMRRNVSANFTRALNEQSTHSAQENRTDFSASETQPRPNVDPPPPTTITDPALHRTENPNTIDLTETQSYLTKFLNGTQKIRKKAKNLFDLISKASLRVADMGKFLFKKLGGTAVKISKNKFYVILNSIFNYQRNENHQHNHGPIQHVTNQVTHITNNNYYIVSNGSPTRCSEEQFHQASTRAPL